MEKVASVSVPETFVPGGWVVGGKTRLLDVWTASNIVYWSPPFLYRSHKLDFSLRHERCLPPEDRLGRRGKMKKWMRRNRAPRSMGDSVILFDTRHDTSANVAHILQNQIGVLLTGLAALGIETSYRDVTFIIHSDAPSYASRLFETLGFRTVENSYDTFEGSRLEMQPSRLPLLSFSGTALRAHAQSIGILDESDEKKGAVFLARRGRRGLANQDEIELLLKKQDFETVYAEDLSIEGQIQTIANAKRIFGLHGAALGYQLFRNPDHHGVVMECFPSAFITNWSRSMCLRGGDTWLGCQGDLSAEVMKNILGDAHPHDLEGDSFRVDPAAVSTVLNMAKRASSEGKDCDPQALLLDLEPIIVDPEHR